MERRTGARGLRSIMENLLLDSMYQIPSLVGVEKLVVDESCGRDESSASYVLY